MLYLTEYTTFLFRKYIKLRFNFKNFDSKISDE